MRWARPEIELRSLAFCTLLALFVVGCQSSLSAPGASGGPAAGGGVDLAKGSAPGGAAAQGAPAVTSTPRPLATATATPRPPATATTVPSPTAVPAATWAKGAPELVRGDTTRPFVAITLDAGAGSEFTPAILGALREKKVQATVFLTGKWAEENPTLVKQIVADGHEVGNHSYDHPDFTTIKPAAMIDEINRTEEIIRKVTGKSTRPLFRYPFGARDARARATVTELGYRSIYWTLDSQDWRAETTPESEIEIVMSNVANGNILIFHLNGEPTSKCLGQIIDQLRARGFVLGKVTQLPTQS